MTRPSSSLHVDRSDQPIATPAAASARERMDWADCAKGLSIILVVLNHTTVGAAGYDLISPLTEYLLNEPFRLLRMPTFFLISGMLAAISVRRPAATFYGKTITQLAWIFVIWNLINYVPRWLFTIYSTGWVDFERLLWAFVYPVQQMWFIWALLIFYLAVRLLRWMPAAGIVALAAILFADPLGSDHATTATSSLFIYFALGFALSSTIPELVRRADVRHWLIAAGLLAASMIPWMLLPDYHDVRLEILVVAAAVSTVILTCARLAGTPVGHALVWIGQRSLPIYVMHILAAAFIRNVLLALGIVEGGVPLVLIVWFSATLLSLAAFELMMRLGLGFLFNAPDLSRFIKSRNPTPMSGTPSPAR